MDQPLATSLTQKSQLMVSALAALWVGLLYDPQSLTDAGELISGGAGKHDIRATPTRRGMVSMAGGVGLRLKEVAHRVLNLAPEEKRRREG